MMEDRVSKANDSRHCEYAAALMQRIRESDEQALAGLMRLYASELGGIAYTLVGRRELAVEIVQDVFVSVWEHRETAHIHTNVSGYLARAVRNRSLNVLKAERRYHRLLETAGAEEGYEPLGEASVVEHTLDEADHIQELWQKVQQIPESPRRVLVLHWYLGMTYAEIAAALGVKVATVHTLMYRAGRKLLELYQRS